MDWSLFVVQIVAAIATVAAAGLAAWAIWASTRERRLVFQLEVLRDLVAAVMRNEPETIQSLSMMLPMQDIQLTRASVHNPSTPSAEAKVAALGSPG
jgi:hypothetical protein